jgi:hypothetical protein
VLLAAALLYVPAVHDFAARQVAQSLSASTGLTVRTGRVRLSFPLNLRIYDLSVADAQGDTVVYIARFEAGIRPVPLLRREIVPTRDIHLDNARFDTRSLVAGMTVHGAADHLHLDMRRINISDGIVHFGHIYLSGAEATLRLDSMPPADAEQAPPVVRLIAWDKIHLERITFHYRQATTDTISVGTFLSEALIAGGELDLSSHRYAIGRCTVADAAVHFDRGNEPTTDGFDATHLSLSSICIDVDSLLYVGSEMRATLRRFALKERSGLEIISMDGCLQSDSIAIALPRWSVQTPRSTLALQLILPWQALAERPEGVLSAQLTASLDRRDVFILVGESFRTLAPLWPDDARLQAGLSVEGNAGKLTFKRLYGELADIFRAEGSGVINRITNPAARSGTVALTASVHDGQALQTFARRVGGERLRIPDMQVALKATLDSGEYRLAISLAVQPGAVRLDGRYHPVHRTYAFTLAIDSLEPVRFLPLDSIMRIDASLHAEGRGANLFDASTRSQFDGLLPHVHYRNTLLTGLSFGGSLNDRQMQVTVHSDHPQVKGDITLDGVIRDRDDISGMLIVDVDSLDLYGLNLAQRPLTHSFQIFSEFETDLDRRHKLDITLGNWEMRMRRQTLKPKTLTLRADSRADSSLVSFHTGDLSIILNGNADVAAVASDFAAVAADVVEQLRTDTALDLSRLRPLFPQVTLKAEAGRDNPIYNYLQENNIFFNRFTLDATLSPGNGLQMDALLSDFISDTMKIDTMRLQIRQDTAALKYAGTVIKNKSRNQEPFNASLVGRLQDNTADAEIVYRNRRGETGLHVGIRARKMAEGMALQLFPERPVLAFLPFRVNADNYVNIKSLSDISANLRLEGENDASSLWLHSTDTSGVMQELSLEINQINLNRISGNAGDIAAMQGVANLSLRYTPLDNHNYMLAADAGVDNLFYRGGRIGELLLSAVYLPLDKTRHQVDMHFFRDRNELSSLSLLYRQSEPDGRLDGIWEVNNAPLSMFNPVLGNAMHLNGVLQGNVHISGTGAAPLLNGFMRLDTATAYITAAGTPVRLDGQRVDIRDSKVVFRQYNLLTAGNSPFVVDGTVDLSNPAKGEADLRLTANDMQLLDTPKNDESIVYGRMFVNLNSTVKGPLNALTMRGNLHLQGNTNMSYILKESPLATSDRIADLVTFSYFRDTVPRKARVLMTNRMPREFASMGGLDVLLTVRVDPAVKLKVDLDETGSDRIELKGGGDLSLQYTPQGETLLTGRYTFSDGLIKYNMPVISNKTLNIKENSYVEWTGNPFDPYLNLRATELVRSSVSVDGQTPHSVNFEAGVALRQRMEDLDLQFTLDALDDVAVQNQLVAMGTEERSKQAVSMLLTGMYLASDGTGRTRLDMNTALNTFLQSEINHITSSLLKDVDFNFGMESSDGTSGLGKRTDYLFRLSKRFYDDRFSIVLGGQVSTGNVPDNYNNTFINDASIEYRLDTEGNRYTKLFYNRQYESLLEGEISKYGAGIVFRKKMRRLDELFLFRKRKTKTIAENETDEEK